MNHKKISVAKEGGSMQETGINLFWDNIFIIFF